MNSFQKKTNKGGKNNSLTELKTSKSLAPDYNTNQKTTIFAHLFKAICPKAYSYAFDDSSSHHFMPIQMSLEGAVMDWKVFSDKVVSVSSLIKDFVFELLVS